MLFRCVMTLFVSLFFGLRFFQRLKKIPAFICLVCGVIFLVGAPPVTVVNLFDYPFEENDQVIEDTMVAFGLVKRIKHQTYVSNPNVYTGTRLVSLVLRSGVTLPRFITINGYICRIWYRGQPLICNLCAVQGHKSVNCPNKDKCRRCGESGHFARACPNPWCSGW